MANDQLLPWINSGDQDGNRNSMVSYAGDGTTTEFPFNFAGGQLSLSNVKAYTYDTASGLTNALTLTSDMFLNDSTLKLPNPIPEGQYLVIYRDTQKTEPLVDYSTNAVMNEENLDKSNKQAIFVAAEMADRFDAINASSADAITRSFTALTTANAAKAAADASTATANAASDDAASAKSQAAAAVSTADAAKTTADGIDAKAQTALDNSSAAVTTANDAKTTADGIAGTANTALSNSQDAVTTANAASNTANNVASVADQASADASSALSTANTAKSTAQAAQATAGEAQTTANAAVKKSGDTMDGYLTVGSGAQQVQITPSGSLEVRNATSGPFIDFSVDATTDYNSRLQHGTDGSFRVFTNKGAYSFTFSADGVFSVGGANYQSDGNFSGSVWGGYFSTYLSNQLAGKVNTGDQSYVTSYSGNWIRLGWSGGRGHINIDNSVDMEIAVVGGQCARDGVSQAGDISLSGAGTLDLPGNSAMVGLSWNTVGHFAMRYATFHQT